MKQLAAKLSEEHGILLRFNSLLIDISTILISLPVDQIDSKIEEAQHRICKFLDLDRSTLWQFDEQEEAMLLLTHTYQPAGSLPPPSPMNCIDYFPWLLRQLMDGETVVISRMTELPAEAVRDRESFNLFKSKSGIYVPLSVGQGPLLGVLTFASMREEREWNENLVDGLIVVAQMFANAIAHKQHEMSLRESEARLILTTNAAGAGLWNMSTDTGSVWVSKKTRDLFHFASDEEISDATFYKAMHPEDRQPVKQIMQQAIQTGESFSCEYRIVLPDGKIRWIAARGQSHPGSVEGRNLLRGVSFDISARKQMEEKLEKRLREIEDLKQRLEHENLYLQEEVKILADHSEILGQSVAIKHVLTQAEQVAKTDSTVLLLGETGTGKDLLARHIHRMSLRKDRPLVTINCASLPPSLIENELFGREQGAYTGALTKMIGRFELADGSSLFLDEIGELPFELQNKLLRVLEEGEFERLGSTKPQKVNVRIIAATNRDLEQEVEDGRFRQDLFYRLNVFPIVLPSLSGRSEDIPLLVRAFVRTFNQKMGKQVRTIPKSTMEVLRAYSWPGNVRELRNIIERAMIMSTGETLAVQLPAKASPESGVQRTFDDITRREILAVLTETRWRVAGPNGAAEILGLKRTTLYSKMKKLGISRFNPQ
jgi:formate hydrogenlyase transcriptional activator